MRTLYLQCNMGAAGDMLFSALLELHPKPEDFLAWFSALGIPNVQIQRQAVQKCGVTGTHMRVLVDGQEEAAHGHDSHDGHSHHTHHGMAEISHIISHLPLTEKIKKNITDVYQLIAEAESHVHGRPVTEIHFHEVGAMDALADITGVCMLMDELAPDCILASPVRTGWGQVQCAHGILPVPAPATAYLLQEIPVYGGEIEGELCTPTGAALLKHFASDFVEMPVMRLKAVGYGMGTKDFREANCLRAFLGETEDEADTVVELSCNIDDMTGEQIGFVMDYLPEQGALEVFTTPVGMKKNRPGVLLTCICTQDRKEEMIRLIFRHTSTIGLREQTVHRRILHRREGMAETNYGKVRTKESGGWGVSKRKVEYEDLARIARTHGISVSEIKIADDEQKI